MAAATYSRNPIVSALVSANSTSSTTLYTAPANSYAVINLTVSATSSGIAYICIGSSSTSGAIFYAATLGTVHSNIPGAVDENGATSGIGYTGCVGSLAGVHVGPGQSVYFVLSAGTGRGTISGVQFTNG
jgi:phage tail sheath gpL-like